MLACGINKSQQFAGESGSAPLSMAMKWFLKVWMARSAGFALWSPGETNCYGMLIDLRRSLKSLEISLSSRMLFARNPCLVSTA